jgi:ABC-2 type transport system ATP-binding protein
MHAPAAERRGACAHALPASVAAHERPPASVAAHARTRYPASVAAGSRLGSQVAAPAISVLDLGVTRGGRPALQGVSLDAAAGEVTGLLGPSGSGKSTLMRAIVGVQQNVVGGVQVLGLPAGSPALRSRVGYMTQAPSVYADLTVEENVRYFARVVNVGAERVEQTLADVGLAGERGRVVGRLSGGQRARVSLASTLLGSPEVLVLDEPTVGLDPLLRAELWSLFWRLADAGVALLVSSHVMDEAAHCSRLVLLREGQVLEVTSPEELRRTTGEHDLERAFIRVIRDGGGRRP